MMIIQMAVMPLMIRFDIRLRMAACARLIFELNMAHAAMQLVRCAAFWCERRQGAPLLARAFMTMPAIIA